METDYDHEPIMVIIVKADMPEVLRQEMAGYIRYMINITVSQAECGMIPIRQLPVALRRVVALRLRARNAGTAT